jgi:hypothetical protein
MDQLEIETRASGQVIARRNYLLAIWAGRQMALSATELPDYIDAVMKSDFEEPGPQDVIRKLQSDFSKRGMPVGMSQLLSQLQKIEKSVRAELLTTD